MAKLEYLQPKKLNPADELRELLHNLEVRQVSLKRLPADEALALLHDLDRAAILFDQLEAEGLDLQAERGRFQSIQMRIQKQAEALLKAVGGPVVLTTQRPSLSPPPERWWWYIDAQAAAQQQQRLRRLALVAGVIVLLAVGLYILFQTVLAPSPQAVARLDAENNAFLAVEEGDDRLALAHLEDGLTKVPGDPELLLFKGVLEERLGQLANAAQSLAEAKAGFNNPLIYHLGLGQLYLRLNQLEQAEESAHAALKLDETSAHSWLLLGQILEGRNQRAEAINAYEKASALAQANDENEVYVMARLALGRLMSTP